METRRRTPDGNGDGNGDGREDSIGDGNGDEDNGNGDVDNGNGDEDNGNGNEDRIGEGGREAKKSKKPQNSCRRQVENGGDLGGKRKTCRKERVGPVAANQDNLESNKETEGGAQGTQGSSNNCTSRESVSPLSRLIRYFLIDPPWADQCEWHNMTGITELDCAVMCNLLNEHTPQIPPWEGQYEWYRMTMTTRVDCAVI